MISYICTMEYYSAIKRNEIGSFVGKWIHLESVTQSEEVKKRKRNIRVIITASSPPLLRSKDKEIWLTCRWGDLSQT